MLNKGSRVIQIRLLSCGKIKGIYEKIRAILAPAIALEIMILLLIQNMALSILNQ